MDVTTHLLSAFIPFESLSANSISQLINTSRVQKYSKGALVFKRGKALDELYYLVKGDLDLVDSQFKSLSLSAPAKTYLEPLNGWDVISPVSAVAKSDSLVLVVSRTVLDTTLAWSESRKSHTSLHHELNSLPANPEQVMSDSVEEDWMSALLQSPLFYRIPAANIQQLFTRFETQDVESDEIVIRENERGDYFYVIESGAAVVLDKHQQILAALKPGQYFGEEALVGDTTRNATVKMLTAGRLVKLNKSSFMDLLQAPSQRFLESDQLQTLGEHRQIIDVRLPLERRHGWVNESTNIPLGSLRKHIPVFERSNVYVVADDAGQRASVAAHLLTQAGFDTYILKDSQALHSLN